MEQVQPQGRPLRFAMLRYSLFVMPGEQGILMAEHAAVLRVDYYEPSSIQMWAESSVDSQGLPQRSVRRTFVVLATGEAHDPQHFEYIGTVVMRDERLVRHVYEKIQHHSFTGGRLHPDLAL